MKLPENSSLLKLYRDGLSDKEIAVAFDVRPQAVNKRLGLIDIHRKPYSTQARDILETVWPAKETQRNRFVGLYAGRSLYCWLRLRLGDTSLTQAQLRYARNFESRSRDAVLDLRPEADESPWVWVPRLPSDDRRVVRWPAGRDLPDDGSHPMLDRPDDPK